MEIPKTSTFNTLNKVANDSKRGRGRGSRGRGGKTRGRGQPTE